MEVKITYHQAGETAAPGVFASPGPREIRSVEQAISRKLSEHFFRSVESMLKPGWKEPPRPQRRAGALCRAKVLARRLADAWAVLRGRARLEDPDSDW